MLLFDLDKEASKNLDEVPNVKNDELSSKKNEEELKSESVIGIILSIFNR